MNYNRAQKIITMFLVLVTVFSIVGGVSGVTQTPPHKTYNACVDVPIMYTGTDSYGQDSTTFKSIQPFLPAGTKALNVQGLGINFRYWHDLGIVVYGGWSYIPSIKNSFKVGSKYGEPYFEKELVDDDGHSYMAKGEYRYYGYDSLGNLFSNINFIDDIQSNESLSERRWIIEPWDSLKVASANKTGQLIESKYNKNAVKYSDSFMRTWLNPDKIPQLENALNNAVEDSGKLVSPSKRQLWNFMNVLSAPTPRYKGSGRMWRLNDTGAVYYQTFPIDHYTKKLPDVITTVKQVGQSDPINNYGDKGPDGWRDKLVTVTLEVEGNLIDWDTKIGELFADDEITAATYYTRVDFKEWKTGLTADKGTVKFLKNYVNTSTRVVSRYTLTLTAGDWLDKNKTVNVFPKSTISFQDDATQNDSGTGVAKVTDKPVPVKPEPTPPQVEPPKTRNHTH